MNLRIIVKQYIMLLTIGLLFLFCFFFYTFQQMKIEKLYNAKSQVAIDQVTTSSSLNSVAQFIRYYDEVLTQSARNYAYTGDIKWKQRYDENVPKLDEKIKYALENDPEDKNIFDDVDTSNQALIKMEEASAVAVTKGDKAQGIAILESGDYAAQKKIYADALTSYAEKEGSEYDKISTTSTEEFKTISTQIRSAVIQSMIFTAIIILLVIIILTIIGVLITRIITKPLEQLQEATVEIGRGNLNPEIKVKNKDEIGDLAAGFINMTGAIKQSRADVDRKVQVQTGDILEKEKFTNDQRKAILNVLEDVELEKELTSQEKDKIDAILHSIGDGVFVVDLDMKIVIINQIALDLCGCNEKVIGKNYSDILRFVFENDKTEKINDKFITEALKTGQVQEMSNHTVLVNADGKKIPVADSAAPIKDKTGKVIGCVVVFRDVTRERQIDQAKTEFVSLASHQLRTPLSAVNWYAEMLIAGDVGKLNEEQKKYVDEIYKGNQRMVDLVNALLDVSRIELGTFAVEPEPTQLIDIAKSLLKELKPEIDKKKQEIKENYDKLEKINVDPKLIRIVIQNLLSNAVKYTPEKGKVTISILEKEPNVEIEVSDTGYGIPKLQQKDIFTKLFRADNVREKDTEGTGLGLYIVKNIVEHSGGKIWFESIENKGTTFYITIPKEGMKKKVGTKALEDIK